MGDPMIWPDDGSPARFLDLCDAVRDAVRQGYRLRRINADRDIAWTGPSVPPSIAATTIEYAERLRARSLKEYDQEDQGRDLMDVLIEIALQLGYEQGRRALACDQQSRLEHIRHAIGLIDAALGFLEKPL